MMKRVIRVLIKGLVVVVPISVTLYALLWLGGSAEKLIAPLLKAMLPSEGVLRYRAGMGILTSLTAIFFVGLLTYWVMFRRLFGLVNRMLEKIPLVKSLYGGLRDLMAFVSRSSDGERLGQVVLVTMAEDCDLIGFITQAKPANVPGAPGDGDETRVAVYLPMSYQIGGYTILVPRGKVRPIDMNVEDAMRYVITAGMSATTRPPELEADSV